jgi:hypothetical protein
MLAEQRGVRGGDLGGSTFADAMHIVDGTADLVHFGESSFDAAAECETRT